MVKRKDLYHMGDENKEKQGAYGRCIECGKRVIEGWWGDYFMVDDGHEFRCSCGGELELVKDITKIVRL